MFSVLMSVYLKESSEFLSICLESLKNQTLKATEVILVEDGELNSDLYEVIESFRKSLNIISVKLPNNKGLALALNEGLKYCNYDLVARMDSDDISLPDRFKRQIEFMKTNPSISVSSAYLEEFDDYGHVFSKRILPLEHLELVKFAKTRSPISHAVAIFRKKDILAVGGYPLFKRSQDVALWSLMIMHSYKLANIPEVLYRVRAGDAFMSRSGLSNFKFEYDVILYQKKIGFLGWSDFFKNIIIRFLLAIIPSNIKRILYSFK